jgi:hypothetical protein
MAKMAALADEKIEIADRGGFAVVLAQTMEGKHAFLVRTMLEVTTRAVTDLLSDLVNARR